MIMTIMIFSNNIDDTSTTNNDDDGVTDNDGDNDTNEIGTILIVIMSIRRRITMKSYS